MWKALVVGLGLCLAACGGKTGNYKIDYAGPIAIELVNQTPRPIEEILIYPRGATNRGTSWGALTPGAAMTIKIKEGSFELVALSAKRNLNAHTRERPEATSLLELRQDLPSTPRKIIFHDEGAEPPGVDKPGILGVTFQIGKPMPEQQAGSAEGSGAGSDQPEAPAP